MQLSPGEPACTPDGGCLAAAHWPCKQCLQREVFPSWALSVFKYIFYSYLILYIFSIIFLSAFTGIVCLRTIALEAPTVAPTHATREPTVAPVWCGELARRSAHAERQTNTTVALTGRRSKLPDILFGSQRLANNKAKLFHPNSMLNISRIAENVTIIMKCIHIFQYNKPYLIYVTFQIGRAHV